MSFLRAKTVKLNDGNVSADCVDENTFVFEGISSVASPAAGVPPTEEAPVPDGCGRHDTFRFMGGVFTADWSHHYDDYYHVPLCVEK